MAQIVIDDVATLTTPKLMMAAIDDNFDELYAADVANLAAAKARAIIQGLSLLLLYLILRPLLRGMLPQVLLLQLIQLRYLM